MLERSFLELFHLTNCFASIAPRGELAVRDGGLLVPCGRLRSAAELDCTTGEMLQAPGGKKTQWDESHFFRYEDLDAAARRKLGCFPPVVGRMVSSHDAVYVVSDDRLYAIDAATGQPLENFAFHERADWGSPRIVGDAIFLPAAKRVLALDRRSGGVLWRRTDCGGTLAVGANMVFCLEHPWPDRFENQHTSPTGRWTKEIEDYQKIKRRGLGDVALPDQQLWALDAASGKTIWNKTVSGTLWLDYPSVGGPSPDAPILIEPDAPSVFRRHSSRIKGDGPVWVAASGCQGLRSLKVAVNVKGVEKKVTYQRGSQTLEKTIIEPAFETRPTPFRPFTVRLYFAEPDDLKPGQRVFDVVVQGKTVLSNFDVVKEAGGPNRVVDRTFRGILAGNDLTIQLAPKTGQTLLCGVEIVEARVRPGE